MLKKSFKKIIILLVVALLFIGLSTLNDSSINALAEEEIVGNDNQLANQENDTQTRGLVNPDGESINLGADWLIENEDGFSNIKYIPKASYFLLNPLHFDNDGTTGNAVGNCTTVAMQMLMGYHNYYSDARIIPTGSNGIAFLDSNFGNYATNPEVLISITPAAGLGESSIGTQDGFYNKLFELNAIASVWAIGQAIPAVKSGAEEFLEIYASNIEDDINIQWGAFNNSIIKSEINAGRPVIVAFDPVLTQSPEENKYHVVVAYGYAKHNGEEGLIVHWGHYSDNVSIWVPMSWIAYYVKMEVNTHTHNFSSNVDTTTYPSFRAA